MRKIVVIEFVSLDGVIQAPGGPAEDTRNDFKFGGWIVPLSDEVAGQALGETYAESYDLLLGRWTYDLFADYWPKIADRPNSENDGEAAMGRQFNKVTKFVATHNPQTLGWQNSESLGKDIVSRLREIKKSEGPMLLVIGSATLVKHLLAHDLVDELRLFIHPVILGKGFRLFDEGSTPRAFKVTKSVTSPNGILAVHYERAGEVQSGSFMGSET